jgi:hypothetical protein
VSCLSPTACIAVGAHGFPEKTLIESWNGSTWSVMPSPSKPMAGNALAGVSCGSASACTAVGYYLSSASASTLAQSWNGTAWSITPSPNKALSADQLYGVSCVSANTCTAVGQYQPSSGIPRTLIESWNGSRWSIAPSPNRAPASSNVLNGVPCLPTGSCTAVGFYGSPAKTLIESSNGATR